MWFGKKLLLFAITLNGHMCYQSVQNVLCRKPQHFEPANAKPTLNAEQQLSQSYTIQ